MLFLSKNQVRGHIFEVIVRKLLQLNGFNLINGTDNGELKGRGTKHQIDAYGQLRRSVSFLYPIRIICEAKFLKGRTGLPHVAKFLGSFKDISENYYVDRTAPDEILLKRYTDTAAMFSANGFTSHAQDFAYAQGIFLISYQSNPLITPILRAIESILEIIDIDVASSNIFNFKQLIYDALNDVSIIDAQTMFISPRYRANEGENRHLFTNLKISLDKIKSPILGMASGKFPIHLLSEQNLSDQIFNSAEEILCKISYKRNSNSCLIITLNEYPNTQIYFSIPRELARRYANHMLDLKEQFFSYIDVPIERDGIERLIKFKLDTDWIEGV